MCRFYEILKDGTGAGKENFRRDYLSGMCISGIRNSISGCINGISVYIYSISAYIQRTEIPISSVKNAINSSGNNGIYCQRIAINSQ